MNDEDPLRPLRELPLPPISGVLSAKIRGEARRRLRAKRPRFAPLLAAAVVALCAVHLGWTVAFMMAMHRPPAGVSTVVER